MGAGIIFAIVVIAGLAYLVPWYISRREEVVDDDDVDPFATSMTLIRRSTGALVEVDAEEFEVSTPMTRRAAMAEIRDAHRAAAIRRRRGVLTLVVLAIAVGAAAPLSSHVPWWAFAVPLGMLVAFLMVARWSTVTLTRSLDARMDQLRGGWEEDTISFEVPAELREDASTEFSIELGAPSDVAGSLWEPIPVTAPSYISKPLVPRTVRTIDLSAPNQPAAPRVPVTNETQIFEATLDEKVAEAEAQDAKAIERKRAVGE